MRYSNSEARWPISCREQFTTNNQTLSGEYRYGYAGMGYLPDQYVTELRDALKSHEAVYVVYSYATPIAWWTDQDGWTIPAVKYSVTTSRHQNIVGRAS